ncbi:hypothetical protein HII36_29685 [Nonomuraea sp. NN258]|uniref:hypothetical protein n=1 Tax=Nonomuraea antri TaxID=2730852 RepID=UPI0015695132|nr:hypothetical protein [Nonomuraea antri]NRQ35973.1 hypothetical protein [Nonomuraea antri]
MPQPDSLGHIQIGAREIYDQLLATDRKVDNIGGKVETIGGNLSTVGGQVSDHETRIRVLERGRWPLPSLAVVFGAGSLVVTIINLMSKGG